MLNRRDVASWQRAVIGKCLFKGPLPSAELAPRADRRDPLLVTRSGLDASWVTSMFI